LKFKTHHQ